MIETEKMKDIPAGNPFLYDQYHMGQYMGKNVCVMYGNHDNENQPYIIVCNMDTGERIKLHFALPCTEDAQKHERGSRFVNFARGGVIDE